MFTRPRNLITKLRRLGYQSSQNLSRPFLQFSSVVNFFEIGLQYPADPFPLIQ